MDKLSKAVLVILVLMLAITLAACTKTTPETNPPAKPPVDTPIEESTDYHIGIATLSYRTDGADTRGVDELYARYGRVEDGGMIKFITFPNKFAEEQELVISLIAGMADDPLMKAIIVTHGILGTAAAFRKIREAGRDDILLIATMPQDDPYVLSQVADLIVDSADNIARGYYDILRAKNMGATTFVHISFPRHMDAEILVRRKIVYKEACKDLGLGFAFEIVPDPADDIDPMQAVYDMMPGLVEKYGKDTMFFTTNTALHEPIIKRVVELGALFLSTVDMSSIYGFANALELDLDAQAGDWPAIVKIIEDEVLARGMSGRVCCWLYKYTDAVSIALYELAKGLIEGTGTGNTLNDIVKNLQIVTPGCDWVSNVFTYPDGSQISNYYLLSMDTYIFGQGYSGVLSEPVPEKYFRIK